jgi:hypothetical protein
VDGELVIVVGEDNDGFPVLEITLLDLFGNEITSFEDPVLICFNLLDEFELNNACLAFFDEREGSFVCEDNCLTRNDDAIWFVSFSFFLDKFLTVL